MLKFWRAAASPQITIDVDVWNGTFEATGDAPYVSAALAMFLSDMRAVMTAVDAVPDDQLLPAFREQKIGRC